jgi:hypothetical protein
MPSKIGANCSRNEDCINKNCVSGKCTRKTAKKTQKKAASASKKVGESCKTNKDCKNNNCVSGKCSRKTAKKTQKSPSPVRKVSPPKPPSPASRFNNSPAKWHELKETVAKKQQKATITKLKNKGATDGDLVYYTIEDNVNHLIDGDKLIFVGISDENQGWVFEKDATKYTNDFFGKYKEALLPHRQKNALVEFRHDDKFTKKYFNNTNSNNLYRLEVFDDEPGRFVEFSENLNLLNRVTLDKTFMDLLRSA